MCCLTSFLVSKPAYYSLRALSRCSAIVAANIANTVVPSSSKVGDYSSRICHIATELCVPLVVLNQPASTAPVKQEIPQMTGAEFAVEGSFPFNTTAADQLPFAKVCQTSA